MRKSNQSLPSVAAAALGFLAATPSLAVSTQEEPVKDGSSQIADPDLSPDQLAKIETWTTDQQTAYQQWPAQMKGYYWSLAPQQQMLFWRLTDEQRSALTAMTGPERDAAWQRIEGKG